MFSVIFEVHPKPDQWEPYLGYGRLLRPELEAVDGFIDNIRYRSLTRQGWILSLSGWRDEKALVRWRVQARHHAVQEKGRFEVFLDYHLRVGEITRDSRLPDGQGLRDQTVDVTRAGESTTVTLIDAKHLSDWGSELAPDDVAGRLGLPRAAHGLVGWDVFDAVLTPGDLLLLISWRDQEAAEEFERGLRLPDGARLRHVRVVRDYGMFDRREAPQYYPDVEGRVTVHA